VETLRESEYNRGTGCGKTARPGLCGGCRVTGVPTARGVYWCEMKFDIIPIAIVLMGALFLYWVSSKTRKEIKRMAEMPPEKDILLKISSPFPFLSSFLVFSPFGLLAYYAPDPWFTNILLFVGLILSLIFVLSYWLIRASKNKLNNKYLVECAYKKVGFIPGNLFTYPIVKDQPWSLKDKKKVVFAGNGLSQNTVSVAYDSFKRGPKDQFKSLALIIGVIIGFYVVWLVIQWIFIGEVQLK
jgi:hypothetical protein